VLSDGVAGENCCTIMVQLMYLATWKEYTTLQTLQIQVLGEIRTRSCIYREFLSIWRTKLFSIFGYEEGAGLLKNQGFR
jgi:hypothetical protein